MEGRARQTRRGTCPGDSKTSTPVTSTTPAASTTLASSRPPGQISLGGPTGLCDPVGLVRPPDRPGPAGLAGATRQQVPLAGRPHPAGSCRRAELRDPTELHARTGPSGRTGWRQEKRRHRVTAPARASAHPVAAAQTPAMPQLRATTPARATAHRPARATVQQAAGAPAPRREAMALARARATTVVRAGRPRHSFRQDRLRPTELVQARATHSRRARRPTGDCTPCPTPLEALRA